MESNAWSDWTTTKSATHTISIRPGTYIAKVEVKDEGGLVSSDTTTVVVDKVVGSGETFMDTRDNNTYNMVIIGDQVWFAENLAYLPLVTYGDLSKTEPYNYVYGYFGNDVDAAKETDNYKNYGVLYNWSAAMAGASSSSANPSGVQGICPSGWHLPSDGEWKQLEQYIGIRYYPNEDDTRNEGWRGYDKLLKSTSGWEDDANGTDNFGFKALPGGYRNNYGSFNNINSGAKFWTSREANNDQDAWSRSLDYIWKGIDRTDYSHKDYGFSVRCIKD